MDRARFACKTSEEQACGESITVWGSAKTMTPILLGNSQCDFSHLSLICQGTIEPPTEPPEEIIPKT